jgi:hypothetical protein
MKKADADISKQLAKYYADPLGHVMFSYPWDSDATIQVCKLKGKWAERFPNSTFGPDEWACEFMDDLAEEIKERGFDGTKSVMPIRFATASGHGIGKSTLTAWLIKFIMDTRPNCKGTVTAVTGDQLKAKTWAELGKWHKRSVTSHWFEYSASRGNMSLRRKGAEEEWFCEAQTCREENSEAFAGQHAVTATSFYIFDEASGIPPKIFEVRNGGLTDGEPMVFDFGNPTRNSGDFYEECVGELRKRFNVRMIDSRDVAITNKEYFKEMIEDYGEDSDIIRIRIKGQFPRASSAQFISGEDVRNCQQRELMNNDALPMILGVDVARQGDDDSVIYPRKGMDARSYPIIRENNLDGVQLANLVIQQFNKYTAEGHDVHIFVDAGGGYGGSPIDHLRFLGYSPMEVHPGRGPSDPENYRYTSDEIWGTMRDAIRGQLCLPTNTQKGGTELRTQLTQREFGYFNGQRIHLEPKIKLKERTGGGSPDIADALAMTFAYDVAPRESTYQGIVRQSTKQAEWDYDPLNPDW